MEQLNLITNFLRIKDKNITITDEYNMGTHLELHGHLDYTAPKCPKCKGQMAKYDYQKTSANCKSKLATQINLYRRAVIKHFSWIVIHPNFNLSDLFRGRFYCAFRQKSTNHAIVILVSSSFPTRIGMRVLLQSFPKNLF